MTLASVTDGSGHKTSFGYDADGQLTSEAFANGVVSTWTRDADGEPVSISAKNGATTVASFDYTRNKVSQVTGETATGSAAGTHAYGYDDLSQLFSTDEKSYSYNAADDVTGLPDGTRLGYDAADEAISYTGPGGTQQSLSWSATGNRTSGVTGSGDPVSYGYDQAGRLTSASVTGGSADGVSQAATYDGDGLRASRATKAADGTTSTLSYTWDSSTSADPLLLTDGSTDFVYGPGDLPVEEVDSAGAASYLVTDQYGSVRRCTDATGAVTGTRSYTPNGATATSTGTVGPLRWGGQYQDAVTGLYYLRARTYDPSTASFLTPDPLAALTEQVYGYADNDPLDESDSYGLFPCGVFAIVCHGFDSAAKWTMHHGGDIATGGAVVVCLGASLADAEATGALCIGGGIAAFGGRTAQGVANHGWKKTFSGPAEVDALVTAGTLGFGGLADRAAEELFSGENALYETPEWNSLARFAVGAAYGFPELLIHGFEMLAEQGCE